MTGYETVIQSDTTICPRKILVPEDAGQRLAVFQDLRSIQEDEKRETLCDELVRVTFRVVG